jgi:hypothetical protein
MIQNISHQKQFEIIKMQMISEENIKANKLKNEIMSKIDLLCKTGISKQTRKKKIQEITDFINNNCDVWIDMKNEL